MKNTLKITASLLFLAVLASCSKEVPTVAPNQSPIAVNVAKIDAQGSIDFVTASGKIEAEQSANISTRMMGHVLKLHVKVGQKVAKNQLLVSTNAVDLDAKKAQGNASISQAKANFSNAEKDFKRFQNLFEQKSASQKELDDMTTRYEMAKAGLEAAQEMQNEIQSQYAYANIRAPFAGVVTNTFVKEGDMANPGMPLVSVEGQDKLQVSAMVPESSIQFIQNGMQAEVTLKSIKATVKGEVIEVSRSSKNTGGQYLVKIDLQNPPATILPGMFANVSFPVADEAQSNSLTSLFIPKSALVEQGQLVGIYTLAENKALLRWLRIGKEVGDQVEVLSGLSAGENYIVSSEGRLYNGVAVTVR